MDPASARPARPRVAVVAVAAVVVAVLLAVAYGRPYGTNNQLTYLLDPLHRAEPTLLRHDWLVASTTAYHPVFSWLIAPLYALDPRGVLPLALAQLVVMTATYLAVFRLTALVAGARLALLLLVAGLLAAGGGRALAGSYLFAGYVQPSSLATLAWLAAMVAWVRDRPLATGAWLAVAGALHVNFLVLGIGLVAALELATWRIAPRRLAALLGPSLAVLAAFAPTLLASAHAHEPDLALRLLTRFASPGHYDPARVRRWLPSLLAWLAVAWGALPIARGAAAQAGAALADARRAALDRLWRFAAIGIALCALATVIASIPPLLGFTRLYVWRIAPFAQLACLVIACTAALTPGTAPGSRRRIAALVVGGAVLVADALRSGIDQRYAIALGLVVAIAAAVRWRGRAVALALAIAAVAIPVGYEREALVTRAVFEASCTDGCDVQRAIEAATPVDAVFLAPPYLTGFRLFARRAVVADTKSPPLLPDELVAWYRRLCAMVDAPELASHDDADARWDALSAAQLAAVANRFDAAYVVLDKRRSRARLTAPIALETSAHLVYRLREADPRQEPEHQARSVR